MKAIVCLVFCLACVVAEQCHYDHDCKMTTCADGFRVDCHHIYLHDSQGHSTGDVRECTCRSTSYHPPCFGSDQWCIDNMSSHYCRDDHGKRWHCSPNDNQCHCY